MKHKLFRLVQQPQSWGMDLDNWSEWSIENNAVKLDVSQFGKNMKSVKLGWGYGAVMKTIITSNLSEMKLGCRITDGVGVMYVWLNGDKIWSLSEPTNWHYSPALKLQKGINKIRIEYFSIDTSTLNKPTKSDLTINHLKVNPYEEIECWFASITPFRPNYSLKSQKLVNGPTVFDYGYTDFCSSEFALYFMNSNSYEDFITNCQKIHVVQDELGVLYRGVFELGEAERIADNCYIVKCTFKSPYRPGMGWTNEISRQSIVRNSIPTEDLKGGTEYV